LDGFWRRFRQYLDTKSSLPTGLTSHLKLIDSVRNKDFNRKNVWFGLSNYLHFLFDFPLQDYALRVLNHITQLQQLENQNKLAKAEMLGSINNNNNYLNGLFERFFYNLGQLSSIMLLTPNARKN
jgi:hypothetical protein